jgi:hypothetical protein
MKSIVSILEQELEGAVDIKDKDFLHRYITLMAENFAQKDEYMTEIGTVRSDIQILAESMKQNFERVDKRFEDMLSVMDKRFEAVDKRFEDMQRNMDSRFEAVDKRFTMMFSFMTIGFVVFSALVTVYQFLG